MTENLSSRTQNSQMANITVAEWHALQQQLTDMQRLLTRANSDFRTQANLMSEAEEELDIIHQVHQSSIPAIVPLGSPTPAPKQLDPTMTSRRSALKKLGLVAGTAAAAVVAGSAFNVTTASAAPVVPGPDTYQMPAESSLDLGGKLRYTATEPRDGATVKSASKEPNSVGFLKLYLQTPYRLYDSRTLYGSGAFFNSTYDYINTGYSTSTKALLLNLTVVGVSGGGYTVAWSYALGLSGAPVVSNSNFLTGQAVANNATVETSTDLTYDLYIRTFLPGGGRADMILDVLGYYYLV